MPTPPSPTTTARAVTAALVAVLAVLAVGSGGCASTASGPPGQAVFATQPGFHPGSAAPTCMLHQTDHPTSAYQGGPTAQPELQLTFLAYYTGSAADGFCDGAPPTPVDREWAELYAQLTGNRAPVTRLLG